MAAQADISHKNAYFIAGHGTEINDPRTK